MMVISVSLGAQSYPIILDSGVLSHAGEHLALARRVLIVTDSGVPEEYAETVAGACRQARICTVPAGESSKNMGSYQQLLGKMLALGMGRGDCVVAVGGGMVGDLAGFAAATYMRVVDFYNVPTTLLAQVDSSVGGKTAIDMNGVKNIVGTFHQPRAVLIDTDTLRSLSRRQMAAGLAESVKMAMTCDAALLELIESSSDLTADLPEIIARSLSIKARVVEQDPMEQALRPRLTNILRKCGLPTECGFTPRQLLPYLLHDKKAFSDGISVVMVDEPGSFRMEKQAPEEILRRWEETEV